MCVSPISIPNKNHYLRREDRERLMRKFPYKDYTSAYINVPCGHCQECIRQKQDALVQRVMLESQKNHLFMCTLTYQNKFLPFLMVNGKKIRYADVRDVQLMMKMLKKNNAFGIPFRYMAVSEFGEERHRPHFHILFLFPKSYFPNEKNDYIAACEGFASKRSHYFTCLNYWRRNLGSRRIPLWQPLTIYVERWKNGYINKNYDFHYINPFLTEKGVSDCGAYVSKYMFKVDDYVLSLRRALQMNLPEEDFDHVWSIVKPRCFKSIGFGLNAEVQLKKGKFKIDEDLKKKIVRDIQISKDVLDYPAIFHPDTGKPNLLASYYLNFSKFQDYDDDLPTDSGHRVRETPLMSYADRMDFWFFRKNAKSVDSSDPIPYSKVKTFTQLQANETRYEKTKKHVGDLGFDDSFPCDL